MKFLLKMCFKLTCSVLLLCPPFYLQISSFDNWQYGYETGIPLVFICISIQIEQIK